jgi:PAS domain S-box-containing protein
MGVQLSLLVAVGMTYYLVARASLELALVGTNVTPLWPPTGIAVVALFTLGRRMWPAVAVAAFLVNVPISGPVVDAIAVAAGNTLAPLLAAALLRRAEFDPRLGRRRDAIAIVACALSSMVVSATIGSLALVASDVVSSHDFWSSWSVWWAGDAMGVLAVAPLLWGLLRLRDRPRIVWWRVLEGTASLGFVSVVTWFALHSSMSRWFVVLPLVGWVAWRFQQAGAAPAAFIVSTMAAWAAAERIGPFAGQSLPEMMFTLQAFNASVALSSFYFAAVVTEQRRIAAALGEARGELEDRVRAATEEADQKARELAEAQEIGHIGSWAWDIGTDTVTWSEELFRIVQIRPEDFAGTYASFLQFLHPADRPRLEDAVKMALTERTEFAVDYRIVRLDGSVRTLRSRGAVVGDAAGEPRRVVGTGQDITEWKRAEDALRESEAAFRNVFESAPTGLVQADTEGRIIQANSAFGQMVGYATAKLRGMTLLEVTHPDDVAGSRNSLARLPELAGRSFEMRNRYLRRDGSWFWGQTSVSVASEPEGRPGLIHAVIQDLTEHRRAEALARADAEHRRLEEIFRRAPAGVVLTRGPDHVVEFANPAFLAALGAAPECLGRPARLAFPNADKGGYFDLLDRVFSTGEVFSADQAPLRSDADPDDETETEAYFNVIYQPVRDDDGQVTGVFGHELDVTDMVMVRREVEALANQLSVLYDREHHVAETLQHSFLPARLPEVDGTTLAARYMAGSREADVGGDWYDAITVPDGRVLLVIGDVEGRGVEAAAAMSQLRNSLRAYVFDGADPGDALARLSQLVRRSGEERFATVWCAAFRPETGEVSYANAGHLPGLVVAADGTTTYLQEALSPPIGTGEHVPIVEVRTVLDPGATLILYTDGLVERHDATIEEGLGRLAAAARGGNEDPEDLLGRLLAELGVPEQGDDVAILAVHRQGPPLRRLRMQLASQPASAVAVRRRLQPFLRRLGFQDSVTRDVLLAVSEAVTNAIEHPQNRTEDHFEVDVDVGDDQLCVVVRDFGRWKHPEHPSDRGRGLPLMKALMQVDVEAGPDGTRVTLGVPLPART